MNVQQPRIFGLIGMPVAHSLSPAMHNAAFQSLKINATYVLFEKKPEELESFLRALPQQNICGLNVTVPYKEKVLSHVVLDKESFFVRQIGAVNTIVVRDGKLKGFNTDVPGFIRHLRENIDPVNKRTAILGAGGAARAVAYALAESGVRDIILYDVDRGKADNVAVLIKNIFSACQVSVAETIEGLDIKNKDLLINATPVGMKESDPCVVDERMLHDGLFIYDLVYNPRLTKLLNLAKKRGIRYSNGLGMLLYQGVLSFQHFTGQPAPVEVMKEALENAIVRHTH